MSLTLLSALLVLSQPSDVSDISTCEELAIEGLRIQTELAEIQRQADEHPMSSRHSDRALGAGMALNILGHVLPVRGAGAVASAGAMTLGAAGRSADRAEADAVHADFDQRLDAALDRMDEVGARYDELCEAAPES